jgi:hypothetical protein
LSVGCRPAAALRASAHAVGHARTLAALALAALAIAAAEGRAHVVFERPTLRAWARASNAIALAEIAAPVAVWTATDGSDHQEYFSARVLETIAGPALPTALDFFPHAEGLPRFHAGERVILFLERTAEHAGGAHLAARFPWFTLQGPGQEWRVGRASEESAGGDPVIAALRAWLALRERPAPDAIRAQLLRQLESNDPRLRDDALVELVRARHETGVLATADDVAPFARLTGGDPNPDERSGLSVPQKVALARLLEDSPGFAIEPALLGLTRAPLDERGRAAVMRAAGQARSPALSLWLAAQLRDADPRVAREAATALGYPWHAAQVDALAAAARGGDADLARRAVLSLGAIGAQRARVVLAALAADPKRAAAPAARAELRRLAAPSRGGVTHGATSAAGPP